LLRKSVQQLNRSRLFEPVRFEQVQIRSDERTGTASVELQLKERARGSWLISGPVGPPRFAGPLRASIETRLPGWSHAAFDLSTYGISLSLVAFAAPLSGQRILPVLMLRKPYLPGSGWLSGFTFAPRLGWRFPAIAYAATQLQQRAITWLEDDAVPPLTIAVERSGSTRPLICPAPKRRFATMRRIGLLGLEVAEAAGSF